MWSFLLTISLCASSIASAQTWTQLSKVVAPDRIAMANYGITVAIEGDYAVIGAPKDNTDALSQNPMDETGAIYIYKKISGVWSFQQKLVAPDRANYDYYGWSVAISGNYIAVGSYFARTDATGANPVPGAGAVYILKNTAGTWAQVQKIVASDRESQNYFGFAVDIDGDDIVVGAYQNDKNTTGILPIVKAGAAYIFKNNAGTWSQTQKIIASDRGPNDNFGYSVSISGKYIVVGAPYEDEDLTGGNSMTDAGSAYVFKESGGTWIQIKKLIATDRSIDANFGIAVDNTIDDIIVGAFKESKDASGTNLIIGTGAAYIYSNNSDAWTQTQKIVASDRQDGGYFGRSVSLFNKSAIIGAYTECYNLQGQDSLSTAGAAYIFSDPGTGWAQVEKIIANTRNAFSNFGFSVGIYGDNVIVGALNDSKDANNINNLTFAGAAYFFEKGCVLDNSVSVSGYTITANLNGATYQWLDCNNNNAPIVGETSQSYTATATGSYACEITLGTCTRISPCISITFVSVNTVKEDKFSVYPNPTDGIFTITSANKLTNGTVEVYSLLGTLIYKKTAVTGEGITVNLTDQYPGVYIVKVNNQVIGRILKK